MSCSSSSEKTITRHSHGRTQSSVATGGTGTQTIGAQTTVETQVRGAHSIVATSTRGAVTQTQTRPLHIGMRVRFRIPLDMMEPVAPGEGEAGAQC